MHGSSFAMTKKIVLITTGQPSVNPRLVKEADALHHAGFDVTVLYSFFISWADEKDTSLLKNVSWEYKLIGGSPTVNKYYYLFTRIRLKICIIINRWIGNHFLIAERSQARTYDELLNAAKKIKANWYIGHNLGALAVVVKAAAFHNANAGFDFEDYHRGEGHDKNTLKRIIFLENKYVSSLCYFSTSSKLITAKTKNNFRKYYGEVITLLNSFPLTQQPIFQFKKESDKTLQLFWFSQTIGINRGLEILFKALNCLNDTTIHLTLAGRSNDDIIKYIKQHSGKMINNIHFAGIIQPEELPCFSSKFDVGLAMELSIPSNRDICLTNKVFTYLLAGNAIILSNTSMQSDFNDLYKVGEIFENENQIELEQKIQLYKNHKYLNKQKLHNYQLSITKLNWENESKKLLEILK